MTRPPPRSTLFPYTTLFRSVERQRLERLAEQLGATKSDVLRRGLQVLERQEAPAEHVRSEEHTSELQSLTNLVCRLLLEKKKKKTSTNRPAQPRIVSRTPIP